MKKITRIAKLQFKGNEAKPGPALASIGINIVQFCNDFNKATQDQKGEVVPVVVTVFADKTFKFVLKTTPTAVLIKKYAQIEKGAANAKKEEKGSLTETQIGEIAKIKLPDLNTNNLESAKKIVKGTMKQMGVKLAEKTVETTANEK